jgi:hypothetical protein
MHRGFYSANHMASILILMSSGRESGCELSVSGKVKKGAALLNQEFFFVFWSRDLMPLSRKPRS